MKKILLTVMAAAAVLSSCKKTVFPDRPVKTGTLVMTLSCDEGQYITVNPQGSALKSGDVETIQVDKSNFIITIRKTQDETGAASDWTKTWVYSEFPESMELAPGKFVISATSPETRITGWDMPKYYGQKEFSIVEQVVTPIELECFLSNMKVSVELTDNFIGELSDYVISVTGDYASGRQSLEWTEADFVNSATSSKSGYFDVAKLIVKITGHRSVDGTAPIPVTYEIKDGKAMDHHILKIDAVVTGTAEVLKLSVSGAVNEREQDFVFGGVPEVPVPDEEEEDVTKPEKPYLYWDANKSFERVTINDDIDADLVIYAAGGIKVLNVRVSSNFQEIVNGLTGTDADGNKLTYLDLVNDTTLQAALAGFGITSLPMGDQVRNQTQVNFPLTDLVTLIPTVGNPDEDYVFTLELEDNYGQSYTKDLTFFNPDLE